MKKTFQIFKNITLPVSGGTLTFNDRARQDYQKVTGFFITSESDLKNVTLSLSIAQQEILPVGTGATLFLFDGSVSRQDVIYDFKADDIPARSSDIEIKFTYTPKEKAAPSVKLSVYLVVENV